MAVGRVRRILYLVPNAVFRNYEDEVLEWLDARPQPTQAQINAVTEEQVLEAEAEIEADMAMSRDKKEKLMYEMIYDIENRLRVLEGKPALTKQQYKKVFTDLYKAL